MTVAQGGLHDFTKPAGVKFCDKRPSLAILSGPYRWRWFYADDGDLLTKATFKTL